MARIGFYERRMRNGRAKCQQGDLDWQARRRRRNEAYPQRYPGSRASLAMNRQWIDSEKQVHEETEWIYVVLWNKENLAAYLTKGTKVYVEGRIQTRSYDDNEGLKRYVTEVVAENIVLLGGNGNTNDTGDSREGQSRSRRARNKPANGRGGRESSPEEQGIQDDDVPF
jgi:single-strand DNA-binding protein